MYSLGDVLSIQYTGFKHYGIYAGNGLVIHNSKKFKKVDEISIDEFSDGKTVTFSSIKASSPSLAVQTARKYLGLPYNLFGENCEHFVRTSCGLVKESTQVQKYLISALGTGALLKSDSSIIKAAGGLQPLQHFLHLQKKVP